MRIFISYRRQDTEWVTQLMFNELKEQFPKDEVFKDVNTIKAGEDYTKAIQTNLSSCNVLLVVIGKEWLTCKDETGIKRLSLPNDYVRLEIATAINHGKKIIPVLVDSATMPSESELPDEIKDLHKFQAVRVGSSNFEMDVFTLANAIREATGQKNPYSDIIKDIATGKISQENLVQPSSNSAYAFICMGIGTLILLLNTDSTAMVVICLAMIGGGVYAWIQSRKVIPSWLNKDFENSKRFGRNAKIIGLATSGIGIVILVIVVLIQGLNFLSNGGLDEAKKIIENNGRDTSQNAVHQQGMVPPSPQKDANNSTDAGKSMEYRVIQNTSIFNSPDINDVTTYYLYENTMVRILEEKYPFAKVEFLHTDGKTYTAWIAADDIVKM